MPVITTIAERQDELAGWRRHLHAHPELALEEHGTSDFVAEKLHSFGIEVHRGLAGTGVVGTIRGRGPGRTMALRADMDALPITEETGAEWRSTVPGRMHACGHDGHTAMLLAAARHLAGTRAFDGVVHVIFQPAEEAVGGARVMIEEGLFEMFDIGSVWGLHNDPSSPLGTARVTAGPAMAAGDSFEITVTGRGGHASTPHLVIDPVMVGAQIVAALPGHVARRIAPFDTAVVTVTEFHAGSVSNVVPETARLVGDARSFDPGIRDRIEAEIGRLAHAVAAAQGATVDYVFRREYPPLVNGAAEAEIAAEALGRVIAPAAIDRAGRPQMGSEDFSYMLERRPGCYIALGQGRGAEEAMLHHPRYDFNDALLPVGASYWVALVDRVLGAG